MRFNKVFAVASVSILLTPTIGLCAVKEKIILVIEGKEWWKTQEECAAAQDYVDYISRTISTKSAPSGLILMGLPHRACVHVRLPEVSGKMGWVRQQEGAQHYFERMPDGTLKIRLMARCHNVEDQVVYLPDPVGPQGPQGKPGETVIGPIGPIGPQGPAPTDEHLRELIKEANPPKTITQEEIEKRKKESEVAAGVIEKGIQVGAAAGAAAGAAGASAGISSKKIWLIVGGVVLGLGGGFGAYEATRGGGNQAPVYAAGSAAIGGK